MRRSRRALLVAIAGALIALAGACAGACNRAPPSAPSQPVELWIGGDVHWGDKPEDRLAPLGSVIGGADGVVNLEGPVGDAPQSGDGVRLFNAPAGLPLLRAAGVRVVGVANNHSSDRGPGGPSETARAAQAAGLLPAGDVAGFATLSVAGRRVIVSAHDLTSGVPASLAAELKEARAAGDILISTFHVTGPPSYLPTPELHQAVDIAIAAGARVVAAHGSHAIGPVERRGDAIIAWGLGNLLFACDCTDAIDGLILRVSIEGGATRARIIPIDAGLLGAPARPSHNPALMLDLLEAIGSSKLNREIDYATF